MRLGEAILLAVVVLLLGAEFIEAAEPLKPKAWLVPPQKPFNPKAPETTHSFLGCKTVTVLRRDGGHVTLPCEGSPPAMYFFVEEAPLPKGEQP